MDTVNRDAAGNGKLLISLFFVEEFFVCHFYLDRVVLLLPLNVCRHLYIASIYCAIVGTSHFKTRGINVELALALLLQQPPLL